MFKKYLTIILVLMTFIIFSNSYAEEFETGSNLNISMISSSPLEIHYNNIPYHIDTRNIFENIIRSKSNELNYQVINSWESSFNHPEDICQDISGNLFVVDVYNSKIQAFDVDGNFLIEWSGLNEPRSIEFNPINLNISVSDTGNSKIKNFDKFGDLKSEWNLASMPFGMAVNSTGYSFISLFALNEVIILDSDGNLVKSFGSSGSGDGQFLEPLYIDFDRDDNIYVTDWYNSRVQKFDPEGNYLSQWGSFGDGDGQFERTMGIAIDKLNDLVYVSDCPFSDSTINIHHRIQVFTTDGEFLTKFGKYGTNLGDFIVPCGLTVANNGDLYVTDFYNNRIQQFRKTQSAFINSTSTDWANVVPTGNFTYPPGSEKIYFNQAKPGANLTDVVVNLTSQGPVDNYLFMNIQGENNITAYGEPKDGQVHAFFDALPRYGPLGLEVSFTDCSLGNPTSWYWDFGDGKNSTEQHSSNVYSLPGLYSVSLRVANAQSSSTGVWTQCVNVTEIAIPEPDPVPTPEKIIPDFTGSPSSGTGTLLVIFQDLSTGNPASWYWDFGDGNASTNQHPEHLYETPGTYSVTLTASNSQYSGSLTKNSFIELV